MKLVTVTVLLSLSVCSSLVSPSRSKPSLLKVNALWRQLLPRTTDSGVPFDLQASTKIGRKADQEPPVSGFSITALSAGVLLSTSLVANAVSGGGLDYAGIDITGQDFSNGSYKGKDFTQVIAKGTNFKNSNLQGCRFYKAFLVNTDFSGADLRGASLEDTSMDGATLKDAIAVGSYFSASLLDVKNMENADFTDAQIPIKTQILVCERDDVKGTNPVTGADTKESLMCP